MYYVRIIFTFRQASLSKVSSKFMYNVFSMFILCTVCFHLTRTLHWNWLTNPFCHLWKRIAALNLSTSFCFLFASPILLPATSPRFQGIYVTIIIEAVKCLNATRRNQWVKVNNAFSCFHRGWMELNFRRYSLEARAGVWNLNNAFTAGNKSLVDVYCVRTLGSALSLQRFT